MTVDNQPVSIYKRLDDDDQNSINFCTGFGKGQDTTGSYKYYNQRRHEEKYCSEKSEIVKFISELISPES